MRFLLENDVFTISGHPTNLLRLLVLDAEETSGRGGVSDLFFWQQLMVSEFAVRVVPFKGRPRASATSAYLCRRRRGRSVGIVLAAAASV